MGRPKNLSYSNPKKFSGWVAIVPPGRPRSYVFGEAIVASPPRGASMVTLVENNYPLKIISTSREAIWSYQEEFVDGKRVGCRLDGLELKIERVEQDASEKKVFASHQPGSCIRIQSRNISGRCFFDIEQANLIIIPSELLSEHESRSPVDDRQQDKGLDLPDPAEGIEPLDR